MLEIFRPASDGVEQTKEYLHPKFSALLAAGIEIGVDPVNPLLLDEQDYNELQNITWNGDWD